MRKKSRSMLARRVFCPIILLVFVLTGTVHGTTEYPPHYVPENEYRYESYIAENPDLPYSTAIAYVNAGVDKVFYSDVAAIEEPANTLVFCAKNSALPADFVPDALVNVSSSQKMQSDAALHFLKMSDAARLEGLNLIVYSAFRSYSAQKTVYQRYVSGNGQAADNYSARPGHSEHQTGLAIDILHKYGSSGFRSARFQNTAEYEWLRQNAHKYGFILRYPDGYQNITGYIFEPWHWRYIGVHAATVMFYENITTFEEYYGRYLAPELDMSVATQTTVPVYFTVNAGEETLVAEAYSNGTDCLIKIRDIAYVLRDTCLSFDIGWDEDTGTVTIAAGVPYNVTGTEFTHMWILQAPAPSDITVVFDDMETPGLTVYTLGGNSFVNLRDFSAIIGYNLSISDDYIIIDTQ